MLLIPVSPVWTAHIKVLLNKEYCLNLNTVHTVTTAGKKEIIFFVAFISHKLSQSKVAP